MDIWDCITTENKNNINLLLLKPTKNKIIKKVKTYKQSREYLKIYQTSYYKKNKSRIVKQQKIYNEKNKLKISHKRKIYLKNKSKTNQGLHL